MRISFGLSPLFVLGILALLVTLRRFVNNCNLGKGSGIFYNTFDKLDSQLRKIRCSSFTVLQLASFDKANGGINKIRT